MSTPGSCLFMLLNALTLAALGAESDPIPAVGSNSEARTAIQRFRQPHGYKVELTAAEPLLQNVVSFGFDSLNRIHVVETHRRRTSVFDIRNFPGWLDSDYGLRTVADRAAFYEREVLETNPSFTNFLEKSRAGAGGFGDFNKDGRINSADMTVESERIRTLEDLDGDGRYDRATTLAEGFRDSVSGVAAGVLAQGTNIWFTCIPDLWRISIPQSLSLPETPLVPGQASAEGFSIIRKHSGFGVHVAFGGHDMHGLKMGPDGRIYWSIADRGSDWRRSFESVFFPGDFLKNLIPDTGAIFRSNPDGSEIEVVAVGLRNPQELAFDDHGNLWTGDNNADGGDRARLVYVLPGSDSGWRIGWQWINQPKLGAWNSEGLWWNASTNTGAYILPPAGHVGRGPSGLAWYPGTGMPVHMQDRFLMCDFPDGVRSFGVRAYGAGFEVIDDRQFLWGLFATDVDFGPRGGAYVSDWVQGWEKTGNGRIYRVFDEMALADPVVEETARLLREGFESKPPALLSELLGHKDQRVRQESQWALARSPAAGLTAFKGKADKGNALLARLHSIWGLGQISRAGGAESSASIGTLSALLQDESAEIRTQAIQVLGECRQKSVAASIQSLLRDESPRVRSAAAIALGRLQASDSVVELKKAVGSNTTRDPWLRHSLVMGLVGTATARELADWASDSNEEVRLAAALALRRKRSGTLTNFLADQSLQVRIEAARGIYDTGITAGLAGLASKNLESKSELNSRLRDTLAKASNLRILNACYRVGRSEDLQKLARVAATQGTEPDERVEALELLSAWSNPAKRDRITGHFDPAPVRSRDSAAATLREVVAQCLDASTPVVVQMAAMKAVRSLQVKSAASAIHSLALTPGCPDETGAEALRTLGEIQSPLFKDLLGSAEKSGGPLMRKTAMELTRNNLTRSISELQNDLARGSLQARRMALDELGKRSDGEMILDAWLDKSMKRETSPEIELELIEAAKMRQSASLASKIKALENRDGPEKSLADFRFSLFGGDPGNGKKLFMERQELGCQRCHSITPGDGGEVGPALAGIASKRNREYLLESILRPNANIAEGFEQIVVETTRGEVLTGILKSEKEGRLQILSAEDGLVTIESARIKGRSRGLSSMPEGMADLVTRRELRDLVAFLASLK